MSEAVAEAAMRPIKNPAVHVRHCCVLHSCKYGDVNCPVVCGEAKQEHPCEQCADEGILNMAMLEKVATHEVKTCPYCSHVLGQPDELAEHGSKTRVEIDLLDMIQAATPRVPAELIAAAVESGHDEADVREAVANLISRNAILFNRDWNFVLNTETRSA